MEENKKTVKLLPEQEKAVLHNDGNIIVSASAGSGKTFVMIERLIRLILEGKTTVNGVLAMTFTESAADEMREKLKEAICKKINENADKDGTLLSQLGDIPTADICTIDGFCSKLIRRYFYVVGLSPDFKILDEDGAAVLKAECIDKTFRKLYEGKQEWFYKLFRRFAKKRFDTDFKEKIIKLHSFIEAEAEPEKFLDKSINNYTADGYDGLVKTFKTQHVNPYLIKMRSIYQKDIEECKEKGYTRGEGHCLKCINALTDIIDCLPEDMATAAQNFPSAFAFDKKESMPSCDLPFRDRVQKNRNDVGAFLKEAISVISLGKADDLEALKETTANVAEIVRLFDDTYSAEKREENLLDFADLEHFALKILKDNTVAADVRSKYQYIFVDEYQDTNGAQEALINMIANNNVFMVGDEKQSIYAFRGCRPEFFREKALDMEARGEVKVDLNANFRSAPAILDLVNAIFDEAMTKEDYGTDYKKGHRLVDGGLYAGGGEAAYGRAKLHVFKKPKRERAEEIAPEGVYDVLDEAVKTMNADEVERVDESYLVAKLIEEELGKKYYDVKAKEFKEIGLDDIVILTHRKASAAIARIVHGLARRGISVVSKVKQNICDFPEVALLINALKLIDSVEQDFPLAITLKSAIGGFCEEDLAEIALYFKNSGQYGGFYQAYQYYLKNADTPLCERLKAFNRYFADVRTLADHLSARDILAKLVNDSNLEAHLFVKQWGAARVRRVRQFITIAEQRGAQCSVKDYLDVIKNSASTFEVAEVMDENAIRAMTIHASKGLEFPVVIVAEAQAGISKKGLGEGEDLLISREDGFIVKSYDDENKRSKETLLRHIVRRRLHEANIREALRTFYVATTRAKFSMHVVWTGEPDDREDYLYSARGYFDFIPKNLPVTYYEESDLEFMRQGSTGAKTALFAKPDTAAMEEMRRSYAYVYPYPEEIQLPLKTSVTGAVTASSEFDVGTQKYDEEVRFIEDDTQPTVSAAAMSDEGINTAQTLTLDNQSADDQTGVERGVIAHKIMENYDFTCDLSFEEQIDKMIASGVLATEELSKINPERLKRVINSGALRGFTGSLYREQPFMVNVEANRLFDVKTEEQVLVQGVIDLLAVDGNSARIADYKYSLLPPEALSKKYLKQLDLYAYAVEKVLGKQVTDKVLINLFSGDVINIK